ncbi:TPR-like protein [Pilatotrama ljubarskyi]|nr:TPR-like protein [Pilatotrama ljubarskyi]
MSSSEIETLTSPEVAATESGSGNGLAAGGDILEKIEKAKEFKEKGDKAFQGDDLQNALMMYHQAILHLKGLDKNAVQKALGKPVPAPPPIEAVDQAAQEKPRTEADELLEKIYANMCQCHVKRGNWKRVIETADKVLEHNPKNRKALFRKARAHGETGWFEKAEKILEDLIKDAEAQEKEACQAELARLREKEKKLTAAHDAKMKGFLNKEKVNLSAD